ncbi:MAG TPA: zinc-dependent alcohol dehydrogenase family protein [Solirubrobacterales bacterium]|jgi:propanol-preferring alcohol dehydrogenase|nr:zinc-dependent alcohol dehydrogenase family protein [Solirubrobacterales bacterium]
MVLDRPREPLTERELPDPAPEQGQVLIEVSACAVCRTDLHIFDGELTEPKLPLVPGHMIVGRVAARGEGAARFAEGDRIGVPWLGWVDGTCRYCRTGRENLCVQGKFTGYDFDGGYAERTVADERFCFPIPDSYSDEHAAPLLCSGLIGYRSLRLAGEGERLGMYGFGSSAHLIIQVAVHDGWKVYALTREGDTEKQEQARSLGATWAGAVGDPEAGDLDAAIIFAPAGELVPAALRALAPGGTVVCAGIHMSDIPSFPYEILWHEHSVRSVANLTRQDGEEFLSLAPEVPVETEIELYELADANRALDDIRHGRVGGTAVLQIGG